MKYLTLALVTVFLIQTGYVLLARDYDNYVRSSECISKYIQVGVERSQIEVSGSTCYIK